MCDVFSGPVVATVWEGKGVVATGRKLVGATNPLASGAPLQMHPLLLPVNRHSYQHCTVGNPSAQGAMNVKSDTTICSASCLSRLVTVIAALRYLPSMHHMQDVALQSPAASAETSALMSAAMSSMDPTQWRAPSARLDCGFLRA